MEKMEKKVYISNEEREKCKKVAEVFSGISEEKVMVLDLGRFGFLRLLGFVYPHGFDDMISYFDSRELFEDLWWDWLYIYLQNTIAEDSPLIDLDYEDMVLKLSEEEQKRLADQKREFAEKAEITL